MARLSGYYIDLDRTFRELGEVEDDQSEYLALLGRSNYKKWPDLLEYRRVIVLSEAGSGKTEEIRNAAKRLISEGKPAFFLRLEHITEAIDDIAFEEGSLSAFEAWLRSDDEGWLFLDSVDEARLRDPGDFEKAIKRIGRKVASAKQRLHLVVTGRASAWRPKTDRALCAREIPFDPTVTPPNGESSDAGQASKSEPQADTSSSFLVVALNDLDRRQVDTFLQTRSISDTKAFLEAVERADAWSFTTRPQDLEELIGFWAQNQKIGSRLEIIEASVNRRLAERDQTRDEAKPISFQRLKDAACRLAGASVLTTEANIQVPDGAALQPGLSSRDILPDWTAPNISVLLERPVFDEAIYGTVRFHHRSVREYLAALWFRDLLAKPTSRQAIEQLFFRTQYGLEVVVPRLRPILPWLAIFDQRILERVEQIEPEVLFEGGDPSQLAPETRRRLLRFVCARLAENRSSRSVTDYAAVQRFAAEDIAHDIKKLIKQYQGAPEVLSFLVRMIWQGELEGAAPEAIAIAANPTSEKYLRIAAFRAVDGVGSTANLDAIRTTFAAEGASLKRDWLAELLSSAPATPHNIGWLDQCLRKVGESNPHRLDGLDDAVTGFVSRLAIDDLPAMLTCLAALLDRKPHLDRYGCEVSQQYAWLIEPTAAGLSRLVNGQHAGVLAQPLLGLFRKVSAGRSYEAGGLRDLKGDLSKSVPSWFELNDAVFWDDIERERASDREEGRRVTRFWQAGLWNSFARFDAGDFERAVRMIGERDLHDDKLVALSLAFSIYVESGRKRADRQALWGAASGVGALETELGTLMRPPADSARRKHKQWERDFERRQRERKRQHEAAHKSWRDWLSANVEKLREPGFDDPAAVSKAQMYVYNRLRELSEDRNQYTYSDWHVLEPELGPKIARAFRDGAVAYWRNNSPKLVSEGAPNNSTAFSSMLGLVGLGIEAHETEDWTSRLTAADAEITFRYAVKELNGFPFWLQQVFERFPDRITTLALGEINHELHRATKDHELHYLLYDVSWSGQWLWDRVAPPLLKRLRKEPDNLQSLEKLLKIINGSSVSSDDIAKLAARKAQTLGRIDNLACWFATWAGVAPEEALQALEDRLPKLAEEDGLKLAMGFITRLVGSHHSSGISARDAFRTPAHLKRLIDLVHTMVRIEDDIDRAGKGVYTPNLRDNAQDARDHLTSLLEEMPGKAAFSALEALSREHPHVSARSWYHLKARRKAQTDAEGQEWSAKQVLEFHREQERTPANHQELFDLAVHRFRDLKADLENGDSSVATTLLKVEQEVEMRKYLGGELRKLANGRYSIANEDELADAKRIDLRFFGTGFDGPVPVELKLSDKWTGPDLYERLENQLCGDYLRDRHSSMGLFVLVHRGQQSTWRFPGGEIVDFEKLVEKLQALGENLARSMPSVERVEVLGIDLTARSRIRRG
ncbi:NACHT domain-containing protein [Marinicauda pacifica]|uniref:NACHT domain-containing protein n=1 Tax=Marinicauda pacifica TaxID=1133559 RepID=UPI0035C7B4B9